MSYSVESKCSTCTKRPGCNDHELIQGAVHTIHTLCGKGHKGAGVVAIDCGNHEQRELEKADVTQESGDTEGVGELKDRDPDCGQ